MSESWKVLGISVGRAGVLCRSNGKPEQSAYIKEAIDGATYLGTLGFKGDEHVYKTHGGPDRAVLGYSKTLYQYWECRYGIEMPPLAALGENITVTGATDEEIYIGDTFHLGSATLQVSQPRQPCWKHAARYGIREFTSEMVRTGYTGYLMRVLRPGRVTTGAELSLVDRNPNSVSVAEAARILYRDRHDIDGARHLARVPQLASYSKTMLDARLKIND